MRFTTHQFIFPKKGNTDKECEDAIASKINTGRFAVADGATEGYDSRRWARMLVRTWVTKGFDVYDNHSLSRNIERLGKILAGRWFRKTLPWYLEEKARQGAFAAFIGLEVLESHSFPGAKNWRSLALGDCCLFLERNNSRLCTFPIDDPEAFNNRPYLISSIPPILRIIENSKLIAEGYCREEDVFLLMSDAISQWYLCHAPINSDAYHLFHMLLQQEDKSALNLMIERERIEGRLRNDDIAILCIKIAPSENGTSMCEGGGP